MGANARQIANRFIGAAQKYPNERPDIFRSAAYTFMGLAQDPNNVRSAKQLADIGLEFASAAHHERPATMDDFQDLLRETQTAYDQTDDPMDLVSRRREIHDERTKITPGFVSIAPESFNRDATLGRSAVIKFAPTNDEIAQGILQSQNVAFWQGVKKEAQAMTVDASLGFLPPIPITFEGAGPLLNNRPFGEVEFGSDGNRTKIKFDLGFGKRFTVVGNYIAVTVGMDPPLAGMPTSQITAGASIGAFAAPSQAPLILTEYVDGLAAGTTSGIMHIPLKATQILPVQFNATIGDSFTFTFFDYGGNVISTFTYVIATNPPWTTIPVYGDMAFMSIFSQVGNDPVNTARFRIPFQLSM